MGLHDTTSTPRAAAASTMAASEGVTPASRFARTLSRTRLSRTRLRTVPERSRVHPFASRLRMAVSERLCWRPIQALAISQTAFEAWALISLALARAHARARGANRRDLRHLAHPRTSLDTVRSLMEPYPGLPV